MEAYVLDQNFNTIGVVNSYSSLIWSERYFKAGEFELKTAIGSSCDKLTATDNYISVDDSDHIMIIEEVESVSDDDEGFYLLKTGRSLESILERRIVWQQTILDTDLEDAIYTLLYNNFMDGAATERQIPNFTMRRTGNFTQYHVEAQYTGDNIYEVVSTLCESFGVGFKITLESGKLVFSLYEGTDRSYSQSDNPYIVFSPSFDNLFNSNYYQSKKEHKNVALIAGEGEGLERKTATVGTMSGMSRRELYVDARDLSQNLQDDDVSTHVSDADYIKQLQQRGTESLEEYKQIETFEGDIDVTRLYHYKEDFFLGDIVQVESEQGATASSRIIEMTITEDGSGITYTPTFY